MPRVSVLDEARPLVWYELTHAELGPWTEFPDDRRRAEGGRRETRSDVSSATRSDTARRPFSLRHFFS
jgi:hypothetical protein